MQTATNKKLQLSQTNAAPFPVWWNGFLKRGFDIFASALGLILLAPFILPVAAMLKREGPGPVFYRGPRAGRGGKRFHILKFRTMYERPESYRGPRVTSKDDGRVTPLGRWLRDTKLNELPQLWNVLIGEMSLVGPRPEDPEIAADWPGEIRDVILSVRPGITSPASVLYRDEESLLPAQGAMDAYFRDILPDKLRLDVLYVRNRSFFGDIDILFWTCMALLLRLTRRQVPESRLFAGPFYKFVRRHVSWFIIDLIACLLAVTAVGVGWRFFQAIDWGVGPLAALAVFLAFLFSAVNALLGLDRVIWQRAGAEDGAVLIFSNAITVALLLSLNYYQGLHRWIPLPPLPGGLLVLMGALTLTANLFARYRSRLVAVAADRWLSWRTARGGFGERILIVGAGEGGQVVHWLLRRGALRRAFNVIGMADDDPAMLGMRIAGCWVLGGMRDIPEIVRKYDVGALIFTITNISAFEREKILEVCKIPRVRLIILNDVLDSLRERLTKPANDQKET